ncbi:Gx transporter family protein [Romboutsia sp.]|uniref:Gx transporter family protein n=1 Tax=Romboutsia sp. TaxID=1965302 RepID=UPI002BF85CE5|nr:Gx transporter family protein [Romboutsia sp.]HSQ90419.1 Gx transporter family protein [Romboutsia sp.]
MRLNKTSKMIYISLLVSMALILSLIERMIPVPFIIPGAKLGLANLVIIIAVYTLDNYKESFTVLLLRLFLSAMLGGSISTLLYSATGGILSFIVTILVKELGGKHVSIIGVSASAAIFHNIGQLLAASLILNNFGMFLYLPLLSIAGIGTGIFVGLSANYLLSSLLRLPYFKNNL